MKKYISVILCSALLVSVLTAGAEETPENINDGASVSAEIVEMIPSDSEESTDETEEEIENDSEDTDTPENSGTEPGETATEEAPAIETIPVEPMQTDPATDPAEELITESPAPDPAETAEPSETEAVEPEQTEPVNENTITLLSADGWETAAALNIQRADTDLVIANDELYSVGGMGSAGYLSSIEKYDEHADTWTHITDIPGSIKGAGVVSSGSKIYVIGGYDNSDYLNTVKAYDINTGEWNDLPSMREKRDQPAVMYMDNKLYVFGGRNINGFVNSYEYYDLSDGQWSLVTTGFSDTMIRVGADAKYINGFICIYGGINMDFHNAGLDLYPVYNLNVRANVINTGYESIAAAWGADKALIFAWNSTSKSHNVYELSVSDGNVSTADVSIESLSDKNPYTRYVIYHGYLFAVGGYSTAQKRYIGQTSRYSVYYSDYVTGDGKITNEVTENGNSITMNFEAGREYLLFINTENMSSFAGYKFKLEYAEDAFTVEDACAMTAEKEINTGAVPGTDIEITESTAGGLSFICTEDIPPGTTVTKAVNAVILKANSSGLRTITYGMIKGE